jgi:malate permease and related proteins
MATYSVIFKAVLMVFGVIGLGVWLRKARIIPHEVDRPLSRLVIMIFYPALIFDKIAGNPGLGNDGNLIWAPMMGLLTVSMGCLICWLVAPLFGLRERKTRGTFSFTTGMYNYGFVPIPLAMALFDDQTVGVIFLHNIGVEIGLWSIGLILLTGHWEPRSLKRLLNMPILAIVLSVSLTLLSLDTWIPGFLRGSITLLGSASIPVALLLIGMSMGEHLSCGIARSTIKVGVAGVLLRLGLLPVLMLTLAYFVPMSVELKRIVALQAAMPSAVFPVVLANVYGGDPRTAIRVILATSAVSLFTIPIWLSIGLQWLGVGM